MQSLTYQRLLNRSASLTLVLFTLTLEGCSRNDHSAEVVEGRVTFKKKPVAGAGIRFYEPRIGFGLVANLDEDGTFQTPSPLPVGSYQVSITGAAPGGNRGPDSPPPSPAAPDYINRAYRDGATSGLVAKVSNTRKVFDFDLSEPPEKSKVPAGKVLAPIMPAN